MNESDCSRLRYFAKRATQSQWSFAVTPTTSRLAMIWYIVQLLWKRNSEQAWGVVIGESGIWIAITGNGVDSEANAQYLHAAQPQNILQLLDAVDRVSSLE